VVTTSGDRATGHFIVHETVVSVAQAPAWAAGLLQAPCAPTGRASAGGVIELGWPCRVTEIDLEPALRAAGLTRIVAEFDGVAANATAEAPVLDRTGAHGRDPWPPQAGLILLGLIVALVAVKIARRSTPRSATIKRRLALALGGTLIAAATTGGAAAATAAVPPAANPATVEGTVFEDTHGNGIRDGGEPGLAGVCVTDGQAWATSGPGGGYSIAIDPARRETDHVRAMSEVDGASMVITTDDITVTDYAAEPRRQGGYDILRRGLVDGRLGMPFYPVIGNHDFGGTATSTGYGGSLEYWRRNLGPEWYSFDRDGRHIVVLEDNYDASGLAPQLEWLRKDLRRHAAGKQVFIFAHRSLFTQWGPGAGMQPTVDTAGGPARRR